VKIDGRINWPLDLVVMGIETSFGADQEDFRNFMKGRLSVQQVKGGRF